MAFGAIGANVGFRLGPQTNTFDGTDQTDALSVRDTYFSANPAVLAVYDADYRLLVRITYPTSQVEYYQRLAGAWNNVSPVVQGLSGEVASLLNVPVGEVPYKTTLGDFAGSGLRVAGDGSLLAPLGFTIDSVGFGEIVTLSHHGGFMGLENHFNDNQYVLVDHFSPRNAASADPRFLRLTTAEATYLLQSDDTVTTTTNPLIANYTVADTSRFNTLTFRAASAMSNVRIKITSTLNSTVLGYYPSQVIWEAGVGGLTWASGDNTIDLDIRPLTFAAGDQITVEIQATSVAVKTNASAVPYISSLAQLGAFTALLTVNTGQPLDATLTGMAATTIAANQILYGTGADTFDVTSLSAYGRTLIDDADAATARTTLGLGSVATQAASAVSITGGDIAGITDLAVADGGTGASTAAGARTNLGLAAVAASGSYTDLTNVPSGTYTPTGTIVTNLTGITIQPAQYFRQGSVVTVSGSFTADPTANNSAVELGLSLPIASTFAHVYECAGAGVSPAIAGQACAVLADTVNNRASVQYVSQSGSNATWYYQFTYQII